MSTTKNRLAFPMLLLSVASVAAAQKQAPPEGGPARAFTIPAHETYSLDNGLKVTLVPYGKIPKVILSVQVNAGSIDEASSHIGVASIATNLMKEGTGKLTAGQVADEAGSWGGRLPSTLTKTVPTPNSTFFRCLARRLCDCCLTFWSIRACPRANSTA